MKILAFESSAKPASVALLNDGKLIAQSIQCTNLTHSRTLLPMAEDLLKNSETKLDEIDAFAVAYGPGSFTGIRIGISTVKGLAWALNKKCVGVSTLEAMAWNGITQSGIICCTMDARRNQVYNALFKIENNTPVRLCADRAISLEDLKDDLANYNQKIYIVGDGAELCYNYLSEYNLHSILAPDNLRWQSAWGVAMASLTKEYYKADDLLPVYLRLSQAERERQSRMNK